MTAVDTSIAVAAFSSWHESHHAARIVLAEGSRLIAHVALETYAVLTRLPPPHRAPGDLVVEFLHGNFDRRLLALSGPSHRRLLETARRAGISGGAVYDALIAFTALESGDTLVTLDRRALRTYQAVGATTRLLS